MASIQTELILQFLLPLLGRRIARIRDPPIRLHERRGTQIFVLVPPVRGARGGTARAEDAFVEAVEFGAVGRGLDVFAVRRGGELEVGRDGFVLFVEVG
jgi:hypothetical protein